MKQLLKKSLVLVVLFITMTAYSNEYTITTKENSNNVTSVTFENVREGSLFLIKDGDELILFSETINKNGVYTRNFDLSSLPDAEYYFEIDAKEDIKVIPFNVEANIAEVIMDNEYKIAKPQTNMKDDLVYISNMTGDNKSVTIEIFYQGYDLAFSENLTKTENTKRVYDFSSSAKGNYVIAFTTEGRTFYNSINF